MQDDLPKKHLPVEVHWQVSLLRQEALEIGILPTEFEDLGYTEARILGRIQMADLAYLEGLLSYC